MAPLTYADYIIDPWKWSQCFWQPPGWDWVDPTKDANASIDLYKNNMTTLKEHYGSKGKNWRAELRQIAEEKAAMKDLGLQMPEELLAESKKQEIENTVRNAIEDFQ
jgi:capsid protein